MAVSQITFHFLSIQWTSFNLIWKPISVNNCHSIGSPKPALSEAYSECIQSKFAEHILKCEYDDRLYFIHIFLLITNINLNSVLKNTYMSMSCTSIGANGKIASGY